MMKGILGFLAAGPSGVNARITRRIGRPDVVKVTVSVRNECVLLFL